MYVLEIVVQDISTAVLSCQLPPASLARQPSGKVMVKKGAIDGVHTFGAWRPDYKR